VFNRGSLVANHPPEFARVSLLRWRGTGLGLSISHDIIVKQHGGSIEVDTKLGEFTEFKIILRASRYLPLNRRDEHEFPHFSTSLTLAID
jgi:hypothetical protein